MICAFSKMVFLPLFFFDIYPKQLRFFVSFLGNTKKDIKKTMEVRHAFKSNGLRYRAYNIGKVWTWCPPSIPPRKLRKYIDLKKELINVLEIINVIV